MSTLPSTPTHKKKRGLARLWHAFLYSCSGLRCAVLEESAFRQELVMAVILIPLAFTLPLTIVEQLLLIGSVLLILIIELLNSALEATLDRVSLEQHPLTKRAKDFGSAAVLLALCWCTLVWLLIVGPLAWSCLRSFCLIS